MACGRAVEVWLRLLTHDEQADSFLIRCPVLADGGFEGSIHRLKINSLGAAMTWFGN